MNNDYDFGERIPQPERNFAHLCAQMHFLRLQNLYSSVRFGSPPQSNCLAHWIIIRLVIWYPGNPNGRGRSGAGHPTVNFAVFTSVLQYPSKSFVAGRVKKEALWRWGITWFSRSLENHVISRKLGNSAKVRSFRENWYNAFPKTCATLSHVGEM